MPSIRIAHTIALALFATVALAGCKKEEAAPPPVAVPAPQNAPSVPPMVATAAVTGVVLGNAADASGQVTAPMAEFATGDAITVSITTTTSGAAASVPGTLAVKWLFEDGQVVNEESKSFQFTGAGVTNFQVSMPSGWPVGGYTLEISLNGNKVETREFMVK